MHLICLYGQTENKYQLFSILSNTFGLLLPFFLLCFSYMSDFLIRARRQKKLRNRDLIDKNEASHARSGMSKRNVKQCLAAPTTRKCTLRQAWSINSRYLTPSDSKKEDHRAVISHAEASRRGYLEYCLVNHQLIHYFAFRLFAVWKVDSADDPFLDSIFQRRIKNSKLAGFISPQSPVRTVWTI